MSTATALRDNSFIQQDWTAYTPADHQAWQILFERRMHQLESTGSQAYLSGASAIGLTGDQVPELADLNRRLGALTGWHAVPVSGFIEAKLFFECLAERRFPTTVIVRPLEQLDYLPEPDIFHDVFGHVPMHANPIFADFLQRFGQAALLARGERQRRAMTRLFWFTVEFGLVREQGEAKIYGSGLISSAADAANALGPNCERRPFVLEDVLRQEFEINRLQPILYVIDSYQQLFEAVEEAARRLRTGSL